MQLVEVTVGLAHPVLAQTRIEPKPVMRVAHPALAHPALAQTRIEPNPVISVAHPAIAQTYSRLCQCQP